MFINVAIYHGCRPSPSRLSAGPEPFLSRFPVVPEPTLSGPLQSGRPMTQKWLTSGPTCMSNNGLYCIGKGPATTLSHAPLSVTALSSFGTSCT